MIDQQALHALVEQLVVVLALAIEEQSRPATPEKLMSVAEAAERLGIGRTTAYQEIRAGRLRSHKLGRRRLISTRAVSEYIDATDPTTQV